MIDVYKRMEQYYHNCEADEQIGFCSAMKYLSFLLEKYESVNREIENRRLARKIEHQEKIIHKLHLKIDDLVEDSQVLQRSLTRKNKQIKILNNLKN